MQSENFKRVYGERQKQSNRRPFYSYFSRFRSLILASMHRRRVWVSWVFLFRFFFFFGKSLLKEAESHTITKNKKTKILFKYARCAATVSSKGTHNAQPSPFALVGRAHSRTHMQDEAKQTNNFFFLLLSASSLLFCCNKHSRFT